MTFGIPRLPRRADRSRQIKSLLSPRRQRVPIRLSGNPVDPSNTKASEVWLLALLAAHMPVTYSCYDNDSNELTTGCILHSWLKKFAKQSFPPPDSARASSPPPRPPPRRCLSSSTSHSSSTASRRPSPPAAPRSSSSPAVARPPWKTTSTQPRTRSHPRSQEQRRLCSRPSRSVSQTRASIVYTRQSEPLGLGHAVLHGQGDRRRRALLPSSSPMTSSTPRFPA